MENSHLVSHKLILGGALLGAFLLVVMPVFAYDQDNTHPALTDEIVDFYNLNFLDKKLTEEEKQWLIQGAIDEDNGVRMLYHFYDPVYNRGLAMVAGASSKDWGLAANFQANVLGRQYAGFASVFNDGSEADFSYGRALADYAEGDKKRALYAFGHIIHLLEDAGVPDHTRDDPHPPLLDFGSPYEHEMAKWNPKNFQIAKTLFLRREKPVSLNNIENYFDKVANYSNNNFFSRDTINNKTYSKPSIKTTTKLRVSGITRLFVIGKDGNNSREFPLALVVVDSATNSVIDITLSNPEIGSYILDGYWYRLSKEVVINGAGALNLFLEEAEKAKQEYLAKQEQKKPSFWAQLLGVFGVGRESLTTSDVGTTSEVNSQRPSDVKLSTLQTSDVGNPQEVNRLPLTTSGGQRTPDVTGDKKVSPSMSPVLSPKPVVSPSVSPSPTPSPVVSPTAQAEKININTANKEELMTLKGIKDAKSDAVVQYRQTHGLFQKIEDIMNVSGIGQATFNDIKDQITVGDTVPTPTPTPTPVTNYGGGGGSGGGGSSSPTPTPTPSPSVTPIPTPSPTPSPSPEPESPLLQVSINEIAWMGTSASLSSDEWMELYNTTNQIIDLTGWTLKSLTGATPDPQITLTGSIGPFGFYLLERTDNTTISDILAGQTYTGALSDTGETLELRNSSGQLMDKVFSEGSWHAGDKNTRSSMERINPRTSGNESANWSTNNGITINGQDAAGNPINGTPKSKNSGYVALKPSVTTDLLATLNSPLTINWSAPEDLDTLPASLSYDLRYSLDDFSEDDSVWDDATQVASSSLPAVGEEGASQSASFDIVYEYGQTIYFALKTKVINIPTCDVGSVDNCDESDISNVADVTYPTAIASNSWAMLGKDRYHASLANAAGPGSTATISWEFDAGSSNAVSQPVIDADGNVYFGVADGSSGKLIKLDKSGIKQWEYSTNVSIGTPAVLSDEVVYFGRVGAGGALALTALNADGSQKWDHDNASTIRSVTVSQAGEPHFTYTSGTDKLAVLNTDGSVKTTISASGLAGFAPVVLDNGTIITSSKVSGNQFFTAYSSDGTQLWQLSYAGTNGNTPVDPSYDSSTGITYSAAGPKLFDIPSGGSILNSRDIASWNYSAATMVAINSGTLYVGFNSPSTASGSLLYAINKTDLSTKWSFQADGYMNKQLVIDNAGNAYFSTQNGNLYSVDSAGNQRWSIESGSNSDISPVLTENGLIWGYGSKVVVIK